MLVEIIEVNLRSVYYIILEREREREKSEAKPFNLFNWNII